jgi:hypothetical protein
MLMRIYGELTFKREDALALLYAFSLGVIPNLRRERKLRVFAEDLSGFTRRQTSAIGYTAEKRRQKGVWNIF